jgi:putative tryptophan/tyrosine transport system substrate-binding protein
VHRRAFLGGLAGSLLAAPLAAEAQQAGRVWQIGFLGPAPERIYTDPLLSLRAGLRELGYVEGKNIIFEYRFAEDKYDRLPGLAAELVRSRVDVIVVHATLGARAAKQATGTIPIFMVSVGDPVGTGFIASLARPGGNITGVSNNDVGLAAKRLALLKEVLPKLSLVAVLRNPTSPIGELQSRETQTAARSLGIEIQLVDVRDPKELESAFAAMVKGRAGALTVMGDPLFLSQQKQIANLAMTKRLPSVFARGENVEAGGLMSYGPTLAAQFRQAATYVYKILEGVKPGALPVEEPTRMYLLINLKTAKALGLTIPPSLLSRADEVIQ